MKPQGQPVFRPNLPAKIRKITIGPDILNGMSFEVGKGGRDFVISRIERSDNSFFLYGDVMFIVYAKNREGDQTEFVWKTTERTPVTVEYYINQ